VIAHRSLREDRARRRAPLIRLILKCDDIQARSRPPRSPVPVHPCERIAGIPLFSWWLCRLSNRYHHRLTAVSSAHGADKLNFGIHPNAVAVKCQRSHGGISHFLCRACSDPFPARHNCLACQSRRFPVRFIGASSFPRMSVQSANASHVTPRALASYTAAESDGCAGQYRIRERCRTAPCKPRPAWLLSGSRQPMASAS
jgi:hypothetical protein